MSEPRIFQDEELNRLARAAIDETREEFGGILPKGFRIRWRRYGRGGRWEAIGPRTVISTKDRDDSDLQIWWIVTCEVIAARISDEKRAELAAAVKEHADA